MCPNNLPIPNPWNWVVCGFSSSKTRASWGIAVANLLKTLGAEVSGPVATSADARRLACEQPPDVALVDLQLRGGEQADSLIERLHELGVYVIVTTGYADVPDVSRHAVAILHKPFSE